MDKSSFPLGHYQLAPLVDNSQSMLTNTYKHPPLAELVEIFSPDLKSILQEKVIELLKRMMWIKNQKKLAKENSSLPFQKKWLKTLLEERADDEELYKQKYFEWCRQKTTDPETHKYIMKTYIDLMLKKNDNKIKKVRRTIAKLETQLPGYVPPINQLTNTDFDRARSVSLHDLLGVKPGRALLRCPFHNERTGSFKIFADNKYRCFGCGEYGDVIDFVQKIHQMNFLEAVRFLLKLS